MALFGAPGCGKTACAEVLKAASKKAIAVIGPNDDPGAYAGADLVLIDGVRDGDDVRTLVANGHIDGVGPGLMVQVMRPSIEGLWGEVSVIEEAIQLYNLPYHTVMNEDDDLETAVGMLARVCGIRS